MSYAEMFLMVWAVLATVICVISYTNFKRSVSALAKVLMAMDLLERGKVELYREADGSLRMREKE
jgi:hypothetical protein